MVDLVGTSLASCSMETNWGRPCLPILLVAYNRPTTLSIQFERLENISPREIHVFIDGPKQKDIENQNRVIQISKIWAENTLHRPSIHISERNLGIRDHFPLAAERFFSIYSQGLILEDDISFGSNFFEFCEQTSKAFAGKPIWSICGHNPISMVRSSLPHANSSFLTNIHTIWGWATFSTSIEHYLSYRTSPARKVFADIVDISHKFTSDPLLRKAIELTWKRKYLRATSESGGGSWDNIWELAAWNSGLPSVMPNYSLSSEMRQTNESGTHDSRREYKLFKDLPELQFSSVVSPLRKSRDISLLGTWRITRPYAWRYFLRVKQQLRALS